MQTLSPILIAMIGTILYSGFITVSNKELLGIFAILYLNNFYKFILVVNLLILIILQQKPT